jgi:hypothetical protein
VACSGADAEVSSPQQPRVRLDEGDTFLILDTAAEHCPAKGAPDPAKLWPSLEALTSSYGSKRAEFIVLMHREVSLEEFPLASNRLGENEHLFRARAEETARQQACTIEALQREGGRYLESFWLINGLVAELTVQEALAISGLADVRSIEQAQTGEPPP